MTTLLKSLRHHTTVVADTGDLEAIREYRPTDATTNPTLILKAAQSELGKPLVAEVLRNHPHAQAAERLQATLVRFGCAILELIPGRVSTEVDARQAFNVRATVELARDLIERYRQAGIERERVLIKIAATWEGVQAAKLLQQEGIRCNMTLLFSLPQALACAEAKVQLISPFVGRILDWHKRAAGDQWNAAAHSGANDPGVQSVRAIHQAYQQYGVETEIMGASFRNIDQILALAGCDLLTISPALLAELDSTEGEVAAQLLRSSDAPGELPTYNEAEFRFELNDDAMTTEKLAEGIRVFSQDARALEQLLMA